MIPQIDLSRALDAQTSLATIASLSRQRGLQDQEAQQNALQLQRLALQLQESKKKADDEKTITEIVKAGGTPEEVSQKLLKAGFPDQSRTYLTNSQADTLQAQQQALLRAETLEGQVAPEIAAPGTGPTTQPIPTELPPVGETGQRLADAPDLPRSAPPQPTSSIQQVPLPLPKVSIPFIGQPDTVVQPQSLQQKTLAQRAEEQFKADVAQRAKIAEENATVHVAPADSVLIKGTGEVVGTGKTKPKPLKFNSNAATGGLETIEDPNSAITYHAGNIATAPAEVKAAWDSIQSQQANQRSYKETEQGKRDQALMDRQTAAFENAIKKSEFDSAQKVVTAANGDYQAALDRVKTMERNRASAIKNGDQQAMLSLLTNHIGMTLGAQKGARITQAILEEAAASAPWLQKVESKFDSRGYLSGVTLAPEQMQFMVDLAHERANDLLEHKQRVETEYHDALSIGRKPAASSKGSDPLGIR